MKPKIFLLTGIILILTSCATTKIVSYQSSRLEEIVEKKGTKNELFVAANSWMVEVFVNAKSVIQYTDKEAGIIKGKYLMSEPYYPDGRYNAKDVFTIITISVRDNATKITMCLFHPVFLLFI